MAPARAAPRRSPSCPRSPARRRRGAWRSCRRARTRARSARRAEAEASSPRVAARSGLRARRSSLGAPARARPALDQRRPVAARLRSEGVLESRGPGSVARGERREAGADIEDGARRGEPERARRRPVPASRGARCHISTSGPLWVSGTNSSFIVRSRSSSMPIPCLRAAISRSGSTKQPMGFRA